MRVRVSLPVPNKMNAFFVIFLDYLKVLVWPGLFFSFLILFRREVKNLLKSKDLSIETPLAKLKSSQPPLKDLSNEGQRIIETEDKLLHEEKEKYSNEDDNLGKQFATVSIQLDFERIYNVIFGSQISVLDYIKDNGVATIDQLHSIFSEAKRKFPVLQGRTFKSYLEFLEIAGLISQKNGNEIHLTDKGQAFLVYIYALNYPKNKLL